jgi:hypothetical protein
VLVLVLVLVMALAMVLVVVMLMLLGPTSIPSIVMSLSSAVVLLKMEVW